ncbi:hypothetical protein [Metabacillus halosaccharovorans]|uniref:hypothetical protein n=1 Tax=Metabacillus halosaccharovorans TaxID=930124 RepID=UPI001C1FE035|nr:hypothetical protein [Metabacillus halosaccharovorans]MBU7594402.1 hypothetical protein [Metabacillus halosaccharovorans]
MKKNWLLTLSGSLLAAMLVTGCAADDQDPAPPEETNENNTVDENVEEGANEGQDAVEEGANEGQDAVEEGVNEGQDAVEEGAEKGENMLEEGAEETEQMMEEGNVDDNNKDKNK